MELPSCLDCKYADQGHPCRKADGVFDFAKVAHAVVRYGRTFSPDGEDEESHDAKEREAHAWASDCAYEVEQDYPHLLLPLIVAAMDASETSGDAAYVAAGLLENAVTKHGVQLIDKIEALAAHSAKFRYFLSAIWGERNTEPAVWARVCKAVGSQGLMDTDGRGPSSSGTLTVLTEDQTAVLLKERVSDAACQLGL
jgi:hypothetical protein